LSRTWRNYVLIPSCSLSSVGFDHRMLQATPGNKEHSCDPFMEMQVIRQPWNPLLNKNRCVVPPSYLLTTSIFLSQNEYESIAYNLLFVIARRALYEFKACYQIPKLAEPVPVDLRGAICTMSYMSGCILPVYGE
jgi:hypothetical protein